jgi:hypothetical protein
MTEVWVEVPHEAVMDYCRSVVLPVLNDGAPWPSYTSKKQVVDEIGLLQCLIAHPRGIEDAMPRLCDRMANLKDALKFRFEFDARQ